MSELKLYKSYNFVDKDPVIDKMRGMVKGMSYSEISERSGVSDGTLRNWFDGKTKRPQYATVMAVVKALGWKVVYVKKGDKIERTSGTAKDVVQRASG